MFHNKAGGAHYGGPYGGIFFVFLGGANCRMVLTVVEACNAHCRRPAVFRSEERYQENNNDGIKYIHISKCI